MDAVSVNVWQIRFKKCNLVYFKPVRTVCLGISLMLTHHFLSLRQFLLFSHIPTRWLKWKKKKNVAYLFWAWTEKKRSLRGAIFSRFVVVGNYPGVVLNPQTIFFHHWKKEKTSVLNRRSGFLTVSSNQANSLGFSFSLSRSIPKCRLKGPIWKGDESAFLCFISWIFNGDLSSDVKCILYVSLIFMLSYAWGVHYLPLFCRLSWQYPVYKVCCALQMCPKES